VDLSLLCWLAIANLASWERFGTQVDGLLESAMKARLPSYAELAKACRRIIGRPPSIRATTRRSREPPRGHATVQSWPFLKITAETRGQEFLDLPGIVGAFGSIKCLGVSVPCGELPEALFRDTLCRL